MTVARRILAVMTVAFACLAGLTCGGDSTAPKNLPVLATLHLLDDSVAFTPGESLYPGFSATRTDGVTATFADAQWATRNKAVVEIAEAGRIQAVGAGRAWIVVSNGGLKDSLQAIVRAQLKVQLSSHLDTIVSIGDSLALSASFPDVPGATVAITWGSRDTNVVRVTQSGIATAFADGNGYVLALEDGGGRDSDLVVVHQRLVTLQITPPTDTVPLLRTAQLTATPMDARGQAIPRLAVTWASSDTTRAIVNDTGLVTARATGKDTIRASVTGMTAVAPLTLTSLPSLRFNIDTIDVGVGQYPSYYGPPRPELAADGIAPDESFTAAVSISDSTIGSVQPVSFLERDQVGESVLFLPIGKRAGTAVITASAPRYVPATTVLRVTRPKLGGPDSVTMVYNPADPEALASFSTNIEDSLGHITQLASAVPVHYTSSDTTVVVPVRSVGGMSAYSIDAEHDWTPTGLGTAWLIVSPNGYAVDSVFVRVVPFQLHFGSGFTRPSPLYLGVGQSTVEQEIQLPQPAPGDIPVPVTLSHGHSGVIAVADSAAYAAGAGSGYISVSGITEGRDTLVASAAGFPPESLVIVVTKPSFHFYNPSLDSAAFLTTTVFAGVTMTVMYTDSVAVERHYASSGRLVARLTSTDTTVLRPQSDSVIFDSVSSNPRMGILAIKAGTASLVLSAPGTNAIPMTSAPVTVVPAAIHLRYSGHANMPSDVTVGLHQQLPDSERIYVDYPDIVYAAPILLRSTDSLIARPTVSTVRSLNGGIDDGTFTIDGGSNTGVAWIVAYGPGIAPDSIRVTVGQPQLQFVKVVPPNLAGAFMAARLLDQAGRPRSSLDSLTFSLWSTNAGVLSVDSTTLSVPALNGITGRTGLHYVGPGTAAIRITDPRGLPSGYLPAATRLIEVDSLDHPLTQLFPDSLVIRGVHR